MNLYQNISDLKNEFEQWTNKKIMLNRIRREVDHRLKDYEFTVEERRERYEFFFKTFIGISSAGVSMKSHVCT